MTGFETPTIIQVEELLAHKGYEVAESGGVLHVRDVETGVSFQVVLQGSVLYMSVKLTAVPGSAVSLEMMRKMLAADNGISTSAFQLYESGDGKIAITLNNFCTLQDMGPEDQDDILSLAGYLMGDMMEARDLLGPMLQAK
jgi:hypothetical protein